MKFTYQHGTGTTLLRLVDEQENILNRLEMLSMNMWFAGIQIPVEGIAGVYTPQKFRRCGYATKCLNHALYLQQKNNNCLSLLFGNPNFYEKFGYVPVMPWYGIYVYHSSFDKLPPEPMLHDYSPDDEKDILRLYNQRARFRVGSIVRNPQKPIMPFYPTTWRNGGIIRILKDDQKNIKGYVWHSQLNTAEFEVVEAVAEDEKSYNLIFTYLLHETRRRSQDYFIAALPLEDPFSVYLKQFEIEIKYVTHLKQQSRAMAAILNLKDTFKILTPVFCHRIRLIKNHLIPKVLTIITEKERVNLNLGGAGTKTKIKISLKNLTQLLFGYISFDEAIKNTGKSSLKPEIGRILFPQLDTFTYLRDHF